MALPQSAVRFSANFSSSDPMRRTAGRKTSPMEKTIVQLRNLYKKFDEVTAIDHIDLDIKQGEFVTLLGPSGCGKTTTLRIIAGLELPTSGSVYLEGEDYAFVPPEKRPVNMVFQAYALFPHMTIAENIAFGPKIKKWPSEEINRSVTEMLELVQLPEFYLRRPDQLSGGQAQRIALARALINRPKVLLLDEPLGALDLKLRKEMQLELRRIQQRLGMTFIYVTHDQEEAMVMSDRIVLMNKGKIAQIGTPLEVYNHPANQFVSRFIGEANLLNGRIHQVVGNTFQIEIGEHLLITAPAITGMTLGDQSISLVRPEKVTVFGANERCPKDWQNKFCGTIQNTLFLGPYTRYIVELMDGAIIMADNTDESGQNEFTVNDKVFVGWEIDDSIVLPA
jgi:spermidine/putrescine transport system ATP-binding protein